MAASLWVAVLLQILFEDVKSPLNPDRSSCFWILLYAPPRGGFICCSVCSLWIEFRLQNQFWVCMVPAWSPNCRSTIQSSTRPLMLWKLGMPWSLQRWAITRKFHEALPEYFCACTAHLPEAILFYMHSLTYCKRKPVKWAMPWSASLQLNWLFTWKLSPFKGNIPTKRWLGGAAWTARLRYAWLY